MRGGHPSMRMHHPGGHGRQQAAPEQTSSKSIVTLALPMYTVGIGVFFIYTCCKYWSKKSSDEKKCKGRHANKGDRFKSKKDEVNYDILDHDSEDEEDKEELYAGLDPDYVDFLKVKKQKALDAQLAMTDEQKRMHDALEEMKKSLSFISSKLVNKESRKNLQGDEILLLQDRLASTEAQMCKILTALDSASNKVNKITEKPPEEVQEQDERLMEEVADESDESSDDGDSSSDDGVPTMAAEDESESHWNQDRLFQASDSSHSSNEDDQSPPDSEQNRLTQRKH